MYKYVSCGRLAAGSAVGLFALMLGVSPVAADVFTIDPNQSALTISGSFSGTSFAQQGQGSLTTKYTGTIQAAQTAGTIQFTGSSLITALTNGTWQPLAGGGAGSAPADYGATELYAGFITAYVALRSVLFDVTSPVIPVTSGQFNPSGLTFLFPATATSELDYNAGIAGSGSKPGSGYATNNVATLATLTTAGSQQTLTLGVNAQFFFTILSANDTIVTVKGQLVATRNTTPPLVLQTPTVANHVVTLQWQSLAGQFYQVLSSSNFQTWQTNASNITSASTTYSWTGTNPAPHRILPPRAISPNRTGGGRWRYFRREFFLVDGALLRVGVLERVGTGTKTSQP